MHAIERHFEPRQESRVFEVDPVRPTGRYANVTVTVEYRKRVAVFQYAAWADRGAGRWNVEWRFGRLVDRRGRRWRCGVNRHRASFR